jgi:hypothetical protein
MNTRHDSDLHHPTYKLPKVQKGVFYSGMIFNNLPQNVKNLSSDVNKSKYALKKFLISAPLIPWGNILTGDQGKIWVLINDSYIDFCLLYMVTYVVVKSVDCMGTTDVS